MTYGLFGCAKKKVEQALVPLSEALRQNTMQGQAVADVHQTTLKTMKAKLDLLRTGSDTSGMAWKGQSVEAMSASFDSVSNIINELSDQIQHDGTQAKLNQLCLAALAGILIAGTVVVVLDIITTAVVVIVSLGGFTIPMLLVDGVVIGADIQAMLILIGLDGAFWILGTLAIYTVHHVLWARKAQPIVGSVTPESLPPEARKKLEDAGLSAAQIAVAAMLYGKGMTDVDALISAVKGMNASQLAMAQKLGENANLTAADIIQLVTHHLVYAPNPKHGKQQVGNVGAEPANGQRALDNSVEIKSTTIRRVGVDPETGEIVVIDDTNNGTFHGHIRTWDQLGQEMQNVLIKKGIIDSKGNIIIRDSNGNIIGTGINVIKGK